MRKTDKKFCYLNLPVTTDLGPKNLVKSANYAGSAFFGKQMKIMIEMTNYAKHYANTIYQSLFFRSKKY